MLLSFSKKYKVLTQQLMPDNAKSVELNLVDLLDKNTKVAKLYYIFYFYLRYMYKLLITLIIVHNKMYLKIQNKIYTLLRKKKKKIRFNRRKRLYIKRSFRLYYFRVLRHFYNVIDATLFSYSNNVMSLSSYLEHLGIHKSLRNIYQLITTFRRYFKRIHKLSINQLKGLVFQLKKYIWYYKKLIISRIEFRKFNYFIQFILLFSSAKYTIVTYIYNTLFNKNIINYFIWFISNIVANLRQIFTIMPSTFIVSLLNNSILCSRYLYNNINNIPYVNTHYIDKNYFMNADVAYYLFEEKDKRILKKTKKHNKIIKKYI